MPDLVFARHIYWLAGSRLNKTPFIIESHHPPCGYLDRKIQGSLFSKPNFRGLVVISDALRDIYLRDYPKLSQIIVAHDAADDPGIWHGVQRNKSQPHAIRIGYVGHLYNGRGRGLIKKLAQRLPHITFDIVGGTPADLEVFKRFNLTKNIVLHGFQPHSELDKFYKAFDVVIAPYQKKVAVDGNKGDTSGIMSPLKIFEYMSWGLPMIVSDLPALREILSEKSAVLVKTDDLDAWSEAIADLARDDAKRRHLGTEARRQFLAHHTWDIRAKTIELNLCENQL